jgi:hypothetical protein
LAKEFERDGWVILSSILLVHLGSLETIIHVAWNLFHEMMFYVLFSGVVLSRVFGYSLLGLWFGASALMLVIPFGGPFLQEYLSPHHLLFALGPAYRGTLQDEGPVAGWLVSGPWYWAADLYVRLDGSAWSARYEPLSAGGRCFFPAVVGSDVVRGRRPS